MCKMDVASSCHLINVNVIISNKRIVTRCSNVSCEIICLLEIISIIRNLRVYDILLFIKFITFSIALQSSRKLRLNLMSFDSPPFFFFFCIFF